MYLVNTPFVNFYLFTLFVGIILNTEMKEKIAKVLKDEDSIRYYYLCGECIKKVEVINGPPVTEAQQYFVV